VLFYLDRPAILLGIAIALYIGVIAHDVAQVFAAQALGDPLPRRSGRLTLNPQPHVTVFSVVAMVIVGVGWAEPIPMSDHWRRLRYKISAAVLAGPLAYAILGALSLLALRGLTTTITVTSGDRVATISHSHLFGAQLVSAMAYTFCGLCVVSLIPIPPTDGGRILFTLGPNSPGWGNARYQLQERNFGLAIILALLMLPILFPGFPSVVGQLAPALYRGLSHVVGLT
jgi:Zn-dependent protease